MAANSRRPTTAGAIARRSSCASCPGGIEARIEEYLAELDARDAQAEGVPAAPGRLVLAEKIALLRERKGRHDGLLGELGQSGQNEVSLTDAESRKMKGAHGGHFIG